MFNQIRKDGDRNEPLLPESKDTRLLNDSDGN